MWDVEVDRLVQMYESGRINRRRLLQGLGAIVTATAAPAAAQQRANVVPAPGKGVLELSPRAGLHHVELKTIQSSTALARTRDFYQALFGVPTELRSDRAVINLPGGRYLSVGFAQTQASIDHFAFGVVEDKKTIVEKLRMAGYKFDQPRDSFITDPDGRQIQIVNENEGV
jgi:hypothetical protein